MSEEYRGAEKSAKINESIEHLKSRTRSACQFLKHSYDKWGAKCQPCADFMHKIFDITLEANAQASSIWNTEIRNEIGEILIEEGCMDVFAQTVREYVDKVVETCVADEESKNAIILLRISIVNLHNFTDLSSKFCQALVKTDLLQTMLKLLKGLLCDHQKKKLNPIVDRCIYNAIMVGYNHMIHDELDYVDLMHDCGMVASVQPYLNDYDEEIRTAALMFTIHTVNQEEAAKSCSDEVSMRLLLSFLKEALEDNKTRRGGGYTVKELTKALAKLSSLDVNKEKLVDIGTIDVMKQLIANGMTNEIEDAIKIMWQLAFDVENARQIQETNVVEFLQTFAEPKDSRRLQRCIKGLSWTLTEKLGLVRDIKTPQNKKTTSPLEGIGDACDSCIPSTEPKLKKLQGSHIMISYNWDCQTTILRIKNMLHANGYKVWLDVDDIGNNTLDSMAEAVENSWLILMSVSRKYKESENCRLEAEYAFRLKKQIIPLMMTRYRPDGWLGFIIGAKLYYDFSGKYDFNTKLNELLSAINSSIESCKGIDVQDAIGTAQIVSPETNVVPLTAGVQSVSPHEKDFSYLDDWGCDRVNEWFLENSIQWCGSTEITGKELQFLVEAREKSPDFFYRCLETKLEFKSLSQMATFDKAVSRLSKNFK